MRTNELVKACLGAPFCTLAEVLILSRIKPFAPRSGTKRYTWLADAFNTYVPHMRSQGHQVCFKIPKHVEAFETDTESASLGYVDTVKCLGAVGQNFFATKRRMEALSERPVPVHAMPVAPKGMPGASAPAANSLVPPAPPTLPAQVNTVGHPCCWCERVLKELSSTTGMQHARFAFQPAHNGVHHSATHCPFEMSTDKAPSCTQPRAKKPRRPTNVMGKPCFKCQATIVTPGVTGVSVGTFGPAVAGYFHTATFCPTNQSLDSAPLGAKPLEAQRQHARDKKRKKSQG